jgi:hypothetical protein
MEGVVANLVIRTHRVDGRARGAQSTPVQRALAGGGRARLPARFLAARQQGRELLTQVVSLGECS